MADVSVAVRAKRKRGRPRKDSNLGAALQSPESSSFMKPLGAESMYPAPSAEAAAKKAQDSDKSCGDEGMVGSMVYGVVEGSFDAGFLISVRIGNNHAPFRGVVFQPRRVVAVTSANDVAPQAKMYQRREIPVPVSYDGLSGFSPHSALQPPKQAVVRPHLLPVAPQYAQSSYVAAADVEGKLVSKQYQFGHPAGNLRMVEEDEVMQAFEVSTSSGGSKSNLPTNGEVETQPHSSMAAAAMPSAFEIRQEEMICRETMDQLQEMNQNRSESQAQLRPTTNLFQDVNFNENLFSTHQSRDQESLAAPNLKLDLAFSVHKEKQMAADAAAQGGGGGIYSAMMKNPNIGYHQALVAGNPLLLPPDLMGGEPLEFMMDNHKPKSPPNSQETNLEVQSRLAGSGERFNGDDAMNKLELATPQSSLSTRIADMDFVLSNAMQQPAQSRTNHG